MAILPSVNPGAEERARAVRAMLAVSERVAQGGELRDVLDDIAREAGQVVRARSASILLLRTQKLFRLGGSWGLSDAYREALERRLHDATGPGGPAGLVVADRRQVVIEDVRSDPRLLSRETALAEGLSSLVATPLVVDGDLVGVLIVWRSLPVPWTQVDLDLINFFSDHGAHAIRTAALLVRQTSQLAALGRIVRDLRELTHEHANRIHGLGGLISLNETAEAKRFLASLLRMHEENHRAVVDGIEQPSLAGLLLAEMTIARQQGILLKIDGRSRLRGLPSTITDAEAVTVTGHLITQAIDAVAEATSAQRTVSFFAATCPRVMVLRTRYRGQSPAPLSGSVLEDSVRKCWGVVRVRYGDGIATTVVEIPNDSRH